MCAFHLNISVVIAPKSREWLPRALELLARAAAILCCYSAALRSPCPSSCFYDFAFRQEGRGWRGGLAGRDGQVSWY